MSGTQRLTTQEAADFLGITRSAMLQLLEEGKIPYYQQGRTAWFFSPTCLPTWIGAVNSGARQISARDAARHGSLVRPLPQSA